MERNFDASAWAREEFGHAKLNDSRNVSRLVEMAASVAEHPHPKVAEVFGSPDRLEAAYDFLENERIAPAALVASSQGATARRARDLARVLIAMDGVMLTLPDRSGARGLGSVGSRTSRARGLHAIDAVALTEQGVPLGLAGMQTWSRSLVRPSRKHQRLPIEKKEIRHWIDARQSVREAFAIEAPETQLVFLHDSGADAWPILLETMVLDRKAHEISVIRAAQNRRASADPSCPSHLWPLLRRAPNRWRIRQSIPAGHDRSPRRAILDIHAREVTLDLLLTPTAIHVPVTLWAVLVRERGRIPAGEERLEWLLLTDAPIRTLADAREIMGWYILRWRVEDHHKTWKRAGSDIEKTQLRTRRAIERWMAIHAAVSARALSLVHQARDPQAGARPAHDAYSSEELAALHALCASREIEIPDDLNVVDATTAVAKLGGFRPIGTRPFGPKILRRGLEQLAIAAETIDALTVLDPSPHLRKSRRK